MLGLKLNHVSNRGARWTFGKIAQQNSLIWLLRALSVIDFLLLITMIFYLFWFGDWINIDMKIPVSYLQVIITAMVNGFLMPNVWTAVLIGLNRYLTVCHPIRARRLCTVDNARRQFVGIVWCSIVYMIPKFLEYKLVTTDDGVYSEPQLAKSKWFIYIYTVGCEAMYVTHKETTNRFSRGSPYGQQAHCNCNDADEHLSGVYHTILSTYRCGSLPISRLFGWHMDYYRDCDCLCMPFIEYFNHF